MRCGGPQQAKGSLEVIYGTVSPAVIGAAAVGVSTEGWTGGGSVVLRRRGDDCIIAPTVVIHDSIGRLPATRAAICGASPANRVERSSQRHGRPQASAPPTAAAPSTSSQG